MMAERPESSTPPEATDSPSGETPPVAATPKQTHAMLKDSPFLNGFDLVLAVGTIILGFAIASFAVRNSDFWLHVGTGRLIAEGQYEFGKAPFTYSAADRSWTNHFWLYDLLTYTIYSKTGGQGIVIFKAGMIAAVALLLLVSRKPRQNVSMGVLCVGLALLASAPRLLMQPSILSCFFLALTVFLIVKSPAMRRPWALPLGIGVTFWLWANCDQWFFLGPVALALYLVGELIQQRMERDKDGRPALRTLAIALAIGIVACMLNPHHIRVWQLPAELFPGPLADALAKERDVSGLFKGIFDKGVLDFEGDKAGNPVNAIAFILLVVLNILSFAFNIRRAAWGLLLINLAMFVLVIVHARALPFYAIVAAPITALNFGDILFRLRERPFKLGAIQLLAAARISLRMVLLIAGLFALLVSYAGWLHPFSAQRRLAWNVEPDSALEKMAQTLQKWRTDGKLPPEAHGLILNIELANYCAWYAPQEKTYFDFRVGLHKQEAESFAKLRQVFYRKPDAPLPSDFDLADFLRKQNISYVLVGAPDQGASYMYYFQVLLRSRQELGWDLWNITENMSIFGWRGQNALARGQYKSLLFDPINEACGASVQPIPDPGTLYPPLKRGGIMDKYFTAAPTPPHEADEVSLLLEYYRTISEEHQLTNFQQRVISVGSVAGSSIMPFNLQLPPIPGTPAMRASALLAVRSARRAILASPDHPDGYLALAQAYKSVDFPVFSEPFRETLISSNLERFMMRLTPEYVSSHQLPVFSVATYLANLHAPQRDPRKGSPNQPPRLDLAVDSLKRALEALKVGPMGMKSEEWQGGIKRLEDEIKRRENELRHQENLWLNNSSRSPSPFERAMSAVPSGLIRKALDELDKIKADDQNRYTIEQQVAALLARVNLLILTGQVEFADADLRDLAEKQDDFLSQPQAQVFRQQLYQLKLQTDLIVGRLSDAALIQSQFSSQSRAALEQLKRTDVAKATTLYIMRLMGDSPILRLNTLMEETFIPLLRQDLSQTRDPRQQKRNLLPANFHGDPTTFPFFDTVIRSEYLRQLANEEESHFQLGMNYLEQGDIKSAEIQFQQVPLSLPPAMRTSARILAQSYLEMINRP